MKAVLVAHGLDFLTIALVIVLLPGGIALEGNPIARWLFAVGGLLALALFKAFWMGVAYLGSAWLRPALWRVMRIYLVALGAIGAAANAMTLVVVTAR